MNINRQKFIFFLIVGLAVCVVAVLGVGRVLTRFLPESASFSKPTNALDISIVYAPEEELYITEVITDFNRSYARGINPMSGKDLARGERPIWVTGRSGSSGTVGQGIVNAFIAPNNANVERPTIFSPSVRHWLAIVNYSAGRTVFDVDGSPGTAAAPVVMAIWESRLNALRAKHGENVGWEELLKVVNSPNGWRDYGLSGRGVVYYGHTDPAVSSTALSTLMAEFYASARANDALPAGDPAARLTQTQVNDDGVQKGVRKIESLIKHYSSRTTEFRDYIAQGPEYLDFVALEENDLIFINQGKTAQGKPPEKLVALYPKEGTFLHDHPFAIPSAPWVSEEQRAAAKLFTDYVLSKPTQEKVLASGFRPVNREVPLNKAGSPFVDAANGVDIGQPKVMLPVPDAATIMAAQQSWQLVKKQADVIVLLDTSGSMNEDNKIVRAKEAIKVFLDDQAGKNNVAFMRFDNSVNTVVPLGSLEGNRPTMLNAVDQVRANGSTALYDALIEAIDQLTRNSDAGRIQAIVLLSDGRDTSSKSSAVDVIRRIQQARNGRAPILVIPVAYGKDADIAALGSIARASDTKVQSGDPQNIRNLLTLIGSYF